MEITKIENPLTNEITEWVTIGDETTGFTSMLKADYDALQAASTLPSELSTPTTPQAGE